LAKHLVQLRQRVKASQFDIGRIPHPLLKDDKLTGTVVSVYEGLTTGTLWAMVKLDSCGHLHVFHQEMLTPEPALLGQVANKEDQ
jgi:hypothetical protein